MQRVEMNVRQKERVSLNVSERIASYNEMMQKLKEYIDELFQALGLFSNRVLFCEELPDVGEDSVLYIVTANDEIYIWQAKEFVQITGSGGDISEWVATDEAVEEALDDLFS